MLMVFVVVTSSVYTHSIKLNVAKQNPLQEQSYESQNKNELVLDLDHLNSADLENNTKPEFSLLKIEDPFAISNVALIIYTVLISIFFVVREKQNRLKLVQLEKQDDEIKIELAKKNAKPNLFENIKDELKKFDSILRDDIQYEKIEEKIENEPKYVILAARIVIEKVLLGLYKSCFTDESSLNQMIVLLYKQKLINQKANNYSHIIKAFGNRAAHHSHNQKNEFTKQEAILVVSTLVELLKELNTTK